MAGNKAIKEKIISRIEDNIDSIKCVYGYGIKPIAAEIEEYPIAIVVPSDSQSDYLSYQDNERIYTFKVWIISKSEAVGLEDSQEAIEDAADDVMNLFDLDVNNTLDGEVTHIEATFGVWDQTDVSASEVAIIQQVVLKCHQLYEVN